MPYTINQPFAGTPITYSLRRNPVSAATFERVLALKPGQSNRPQSEERETEVGSALGSVQP